MTDSERLIKAGWKLIRAKRVGCMKIRDWVDPLTGEIRRQGVAIQIEHDRAFHRKMESRRNEMVRG